MKKAFLIQFILYACLTNVTSCSFGKNSFKDETYHLVFQWNSENTILVYDIHKKDAFDNVLKLSNKGYYADYSGTISFDDAYIYCTTIYDTNYGNGILLANTSKDKYTKFEDSLELVEYGDFGPDIVALRNYQSIKINTEIMHVKFSYGYSLYVTENYAKKNNITIIKQ